MISFPHILVNVHTTYNIPHCLPNVANPKPNAGSKPLHKQASMNNQPRHRKSIRQSNAATRRMSPEWKDVIKRNCLERARQKRSKITAKNRTPNTKSSAYSRVSGGTLPIPMQLQMQSAPPAGEEARNLIEEQLHATGVAILPSPSHSLSQSSMQTTNTNAYSTPTNGNGSYINNGPILQLAPGLPCYSHTGIGSNTNLFGTKPKDDKNYITEEEFYALVDEIEEELQNEYGEKSERHYDMRAV